MGSALTDTDFLQHSLDFSDITPEDFENLVFHLLDEMGFSNIQWRKGGPGNSATDGGRDLEAKAWSIQPGASRELNYWVEVKYRSNNLEKSQVQSTVLNSAADAKRDNILIITNSAISNPTLDWINEFQESHRLPLVSVWQGHDLELMLRKNGSTLSRFLPHSLASSGKRKVIESKFLNLVTLPSGVELDDLWDQRSHVLTAPMLLFAACTGEIVHGDINNRPWPIIANEDQLLDLAAMSLVNLYPLIVKCNRIERSHDVFVESIAYILQCVALKVGEDAATNLICDPERIFDAESLSDELRGNRLYPIMSQIYHDLAFHCSEIDYCRKLSYGRGEPDKHFFQRFQEPKVEEAEDKSDSSFLVISSKDQRCQLDLVDAKSECPLVNELPDDITINQVKERFAFAAEVIKARIQ